MLEAPAVAILTVTALLTAVLSAVVGMAGGITLLGVMLLFLDPLQAIPIHGAVQLVSNSSRAVIQRRHIRWDIVWRYGLPLLPTGIVGLWLLQSLPADATKLLIGVFVLAATWAPGVLLLGSHPERTDPHRRFVVLGAVVGVLNLTVGATGPLIAPFFLGLGLTRFALIGTKAMCQSLGHLVKIAIFGVAGFAFSAYLPLLLLLAIAVTAGTWLGSRLLDRVSERLFVWLYRGVLTVIALRLVIGS